MLYLSNGGGGEGGKGALGHEEGEEGALGHEEEEEQEEEPRGGVEARQRQVARGANYRSRGSDDATPPVLSHPVELIPSGVKVEGRSGGRWEGKRLEGDRRWEEAGKEEEEEE